MFESINKTLFSLIAESPDFGGLKHILMVLLAEWAIFLGPAVLILLWIFGQRPDRRAAVGACFAGIVALAIAGAISALFYHPRPFVDGLSSNFLNHLPDSSFPSDHATLLFALAWSFYFVPPARVPRIWMPMAGLALVVGLSRVSIGVHYPFDILGAIVVGLFGNSIVMLPPGRLIRDRFTDFAEKTYELLPGIPAKDRSR